MKSLHGILAICTLLVGCATPAAPGSKEEAVNEAWERLCQSGYCEGYDAAIVGRTENSLKVNINGNIRYVVYTVSGDPGNYTVQMYPTADQGRARP